MKKLKLSLISISFGAQITGCGIGGFWMEGNPFHGEGRPYGTLWKREGITEEQRRKDSWACGVAQTLLAADHVIFSKEQLQREKRPDDKDDFAPRTRLTKAWIACMQAKGYHYKE